MTPLRWASPIADRRAAARSRRLWDVIADERHCGFFEDAGWLTSSRILDDDPPGRIRRLSRDAGQPEGPGVHPRGVPVVADDLSRAIGDDRIELLPSRQATGEGLVVPPAAQDPGGVGVVARPCPDAGLYLVDREGVGEVDTLEAEATVDEMDVRVVEARQYRRALRVDHRRLRLAQTRDFALASDAEDLVAADGDGFGHRAARPGGIDLGVVDDDVDRAVGIVPLGHQSGDERRRNDSDAHRRGQAGSP